MLADEISACQLQALLAVSDQVYLNALSVQRTKEAPEKVFPDDYAPEPDEDLWINRLEIGTPNLLELIGNLHPLTVLAEYLSTAFVGAKVLETLARARKEWAQASSIKTATERVLHASDAIAPQPPPKVHLAPSKKVSRNKQMDAAAR